MTNYEKIKSMSIDKMAEFFYHSFDYPFLIYACRICPNRSTCSTYITDKCHKALKDWLKAESEEE